MSEKPPDANSSSPASALARMREDWNRRAAENAAFYIASGAADSEELFRASGRSELDGAVLDGIVLRPSARALEIGCGVGRLLVPLAERVHAVAGVDISDVMIEKSRAFCAGHENVSTSVTDGTLSRFEAESFDFVFSFIVFQHVPEIESIRTYVTEAARVLAPGGLFRFQVDGRPPRKGAEAGTYDGVKLSPDDVRRLVAPTGLEIVDEWGQETHYHWVTARKPGASEHVAFRPREWNETVLRAMLARGAGSSVGSVSDCVMRGETSLRRALGDAGQVLEGADDAAFVRALYRRVWGIDAAEELVAEQAALLAARVEFREDVLDILLLSVDLRDFVRPRVLSEIPWYRLERLREAGVLTTGAVSPEMAADAVTRMLATLPRESLVPEAFRIVLGERPDDRTRDLTMRLAEAYEGTSRSLARRLLALEPPRPIPGPPPDARREALFARVPDVSRELEPGASFPGEAVVARAVLAETRSLPDADFIVRAYRSILGRDADAGGAAWYADMLARGNMDRVGLVHQLLWSDELRRG